MNWREIRTSSHDEILAWAADQPWARAMAACAQDRGWHAEGDVWTHTRMVCGQLPRLDEWPSLSDHERIVLLFTALLHDAGKPINALSDAVRRPLAPRDRRRVLGGLAELGPGTAVWAARLDGRLPQPGEGLYARVVATVRGPAAAARVLDWQVRDLAPDIVRIELAGLRPKDASRLLRSMARATADVHATDRPAWKAARAQARALRRKDFRALVATMAAVVKDDFRSYDA